MTVEEIKAMTPEEMERKLILIYSKPTVLSNYLTIQEKIENINKQFSNGHIDVFSDKDDAAFDRFLKFSKMARDIEEDQLERLTLLDEDVLAAERDKRLKAKEGSLESFVPKPVK